MTAPTDQAAAALGVAARRVARGLIRAYQLLLSPWIGHGCRFVPTCSNYALDAIERHGAARGLWLASLRLARCHPWGGAGWDPVPEAIGRWPGAVRWLRLRQHGHCGCAAPPAAESAVGPGGTITRAVEQARAGAAQSPARPAAHAD